MLSSPRLNTLALQEDVDTFEMDAVDAFHQADEPDEVYAVPPVRHTQRLDSQGKPTQIVCV